MFKRIVFIQCTLIGFLFLYGTNILADSAEEELDRIDQMKYVIDDTDYCALMQDLSISSRPFPYNPEEDPRRLKVLTYTAKVYETYKGAEVKSLNYEFIVEAGGTTSLYSEPYIQCLCKNKETYYVPDVVKFTYPNTEKFREEARKAGREKPKKAPFLCED